MEKKIFNVQGMKCAHCKASVEAALTALNGVRSATADLDKKQVAVECDDNLSTATIVEAIESAGRFYVE